VVTALIVVCTGMGVGWFVRAYQSALEGSFIDRSLAYGIVLASSVGDWVERDDRAMLRTVGRMLLVGGVLYVQVVAGTEPLVDERTGAAADLDLSIEPLAPVSWAQPRSLSNGRSVVDVIAPIPPASDAYVRVGIDRSRIVATARSVTALAAGIAAGMNAVLIGVLWWIGRAPGPLDRDRPKVQVPPGCSGDDEESTDD